MTHYTSHSSIQKLMFRWSVRTTVHGCLQFKSKWSPRKLHGSFAVNKLALEQALFLCHSICVQSRVSLPCAVQWILSEYCYKPDQHFGASVQNLHLVALSRKVIRLQWFLLFDFFPFSSHVDLHLIACFHHSILCYTYISIPLTTSPFYFIFCKFFLFLVLVTNSKKKTKYFFRNWKCASSQEILLLLGKPEIHFRLQEPIY